MQKGGRSRTRKPRRTVSGISLQRANKKRVELAKARRKKKPKKPTKSPQEIAHEKEVRARKLLEYARKHGISANEAKRRLGFKNKK
jgi:hypothetical protein